MSRSIAIVVLVIALLAGATTFLAVEFSAREASEATTAIAAGNSVSATGDAANPASPADASGVDNVDADVSKYDRMREEFIWALGGHHLDKECVRETVYHVDPDTGATRESQQSTCTRTKPDHPYRSYTTEALETLAYSDPVAAVVLAKRMSENSENVHKIVDMNMRATALSDGQWVHLQSLANQRFSGVSVNGEPDVRSIHARFVLETVIDNFRTDGGHREQWLQDIEDTYVIPASDVAQLEHTADLYMQRIRQIRRDVMGLTDMEVDEHANSTQAIP